MTDTIFKYEIQLVDGIFTIDMPTPVEPIHLGMQHNKIFLWSEVGSGEVKPVKFFIIGTGHPFPILEENESCEHVGTLVGAEGYFVWHLYTIVEWNFEGDDN